MIELSEETIQRHATPPVLETERVRLRAIRPSDYEFLYDLATSTELGFRWRFHGSTPSPDEFAKALWSGVMLQYLVERKITGERAGLVVAYSPHLRNGVASIAVLSAPEFVGSGLLMDAAIIFVESIFSNWNVRKLYIEALEFNISQYKSGFGRLFDVEGQLKSHDYYGGQWWDLFILAIYRDRWQQRHQVALDREPSTPLTLDEFMSCFAENLLDVHATEDRSTSFSPDTNLTYELGFDSLAMMEVLMFLTELVGEERELKSDFIGELQTVRDVYRSYCELASYPSKESIALKQV